MGPTELAALAMLQIYLACNYSLALLTSLDVDDSITFTALRACTESATPLRIAHSSFVRSLASICSRYCDGIPLVAWSTVICCSECGAYPGRCRSAKRASRRLSTTRWVIMLPCSSLTKRPLLIIGSCVPSNPRFTTSAAIKSWNCWYASCSSSAVKLDALWFHRGHSCAKGLQLSLVECSCGPV